MSTGLKIIQSALSKIGAHSIVKPANPESIENGRTTLNSYISRLQDDGIEFGAVAIETAGDELSEPQGVTNAIEDNLAILLQPDHPGTQISQQLKINANIGSQYMKRKYKTIVIPKKVVRETLPKGSGNKKSRFYDETYFDNGETIG